MTPHNELFSLTWFPSYGRLNEGFTTDVTKNLKLKYMFSTHNLLETVELNITLDHPLCRPSHAIFYTVALSKS